jgi:hypothetical protein
MDYSQIRWIQLRFTIEATPVAVRRHLRQDGITTRLLTVQVSIRSETCRLLGTLMAQAAVTGMVEIEVMVQVQELDLT